MTSTYWKLCVIFSAVASIARGWETGSGHKYNLENTFIFREIEALKSGGDVGFRLTGELAVTAVWRSPSDLDLFLLKFEVLSIIHSSSCLNIRILNRDNFCRVIADIVNINLN